MSEQTQRAEVVAIVQELYQARLITSTGGNVSVRLDPPQEGYLITPTRLHKGGLRPEDLVRLDSAGRPLETHRRPSIETPMHIAIYQAYPKVGAVVHTHAPLATALGIVGGRIPPITADAVPFLDTRIVPYGLPGDPDLIQRVVEALQSSPAVILQNHGLVTVGEDLRQAANRALALEETLHILLACRLLGGELTTLSPEMVEKVRALGYV